MEYEMKSVTRDEDLWSKNYEMRDYPVNQIGLLCCCVHLYS
jgi:hypothetical protein